MLVWVYTNSLQTSTNQLKPAILETFGDIAQAIGTNFTPYLPVVAQVLNQASQVTTSPDVGLEMIDYVISLREGIMDAWGGILLSYKGTPQGKVSSENFFRTHANGSTVSQIQPYVESIFQLLHLISQDSGRSEGLMRASMGVIGYVSKIHGLWCSVMLIDISSDLADAFPNGEFAAFFRNEWINGLVTETRRNKEFGARTIETARWTREQVKRQVGLSTAASMA